MRRLLVCAMFVLATAALVGCGSVETDADDDAGQVDDAGPVYDAGPTPDAPIGSADAAPVEPPPEGAELGTASSRVTGGGYIMDVMIGHPISQERSNGGGYAIEGAAPVKE